MNLRVLILVLLCLSFWKIDSSVGTTTLRNVPKDDSNKNSNMTSNSILSVDLPDFSRVSAIQDWVKSEGSVESHYIQSKYQYGLPIALHQIMSRADQWVLVKLTNYKYGMASPVIYKQLLLNQSPKEIKSAPVNGYYFAYLRKNPEVRVVISCTETWAEGETSANILYGNSPEVRRAIIELSSDIESELKTKAPFKGGVLDFKATGSIGFLEDIENYNLQWSQLILNQNLKRKLIEGVDGFLKNYNYADWKRLGIPLSQGILVYGPPGTGKSLLGKVLISNILNKVYPQTVTYIHVQARHVNTLESLRTIYQKARELSPSVVFIEDIDLIAGTDRTDRAPIKNEFMQQLDGVEELHGVLTIGTTNVESKIDPALKRSQRLGLHYLFDRPSYEERRELLDVFLKKYPSDSLQFDSYANLTDGLTGADLKQIILSAVDLAIEKKLQKQNQEFLIDHDVMMRAIELRKQTRLSSDIPPSSSSSSFSFSSLRAPPPILSFKSTAMSHASFTLLDGDNQGDPFLNYTSAYTYWLRDTKRLLESNTIVEKSLGHFFELPQIAIHKIINDPRGHWKVYRSHNYNESTGQSMPAAFTQIQTSKEGRLENIQINGHFFLYRDDFNSGARLVVKFDAEYDYSSLMGTVWISYGSKDYFAALELQNELRQYATEKNPYRNAVIHVSDQTTYQFKFLDQANDFHFTWEDLILDPKTKLLTRQLTETYLSHFSEYQKLYQQFNLRTHFGVLLTGPPGTGKSFLAKVLISSMNDGVLKNQTTLVFVSARHLQNQSGIRTLFSSIKKLGSVCIFFEDIDLLGIPNQDREESDGSGTRKGSSSSQPHLILNELLNGIDGIVENNHLLLIGTTNQLDSIDKALLRSERFGFHIYFPLPELSERVEFFERFGKKNAIWEPSLTAQELALKTEGYSGADIIELIGIAKRLAYSRHSMQGDLLYLTQQHFKEAIELVKNQGKSHLSLY